jgi:hypothetical protein
VRVRLEAEREPDESWERDAMAVAGRVPAGWTGTETGDSYRPNGPRARGSEGTSPAVGRLLSPSPQRLASGLLTRVHFPALRLPPARPPASPPPTLPCPAPTLPRGAPGHLAVACGTLTGPPAVSPRAARPRVGPARASRPPLGLSFGVAFRVPAVFAVLLRASFIVH